MVAFDPTDPAIQQALNRAVDEAKFKTDLTYKPIYIPGISMPFPTGHVIYQEAERLWDERHGNTAPSCTKPTSETATVGEKRRAPSPEIKARTTSLRWDEDASMDGFSLDDLPSCDNVTILSIIDAAKERARRALTNAGLKNLPQDLLQGGPPCPAAHTEARHDALALGYVFGQLTTFVDDLEHSLPAGEQAFGDVASHAFRVGFQQGHALNRTMEEWVERQHDTLVTKGEVTQNRNREGKGKGKARSNSQSGDPEQNQLGDLRKLITSGFRNLESRIKHLENHATHEDAPAPAPIPQPARGLAASIHAPANASGSSYAAKAAAQTGPMPSTVDFPPLEQPAQTANKKRKRGITANTQTAAKSKNGHTLSFTVDPLPEERSAMDTFSMVKKVFSKLNLKTDRLLRASWSDRPRLLIHVGKESKPTELGPRLGSALQDYYQQQNPMARVTYHPFSEGFQIWVPGIPIRNPETNAPFTPEELQV